MPVFDTSNFTPYFDFDYRQLNRSDKIVENKDDKEILLIFKKQ